MMSPAAAESSGSPQSPPASNRSRWLDLHGVFWVRLLDWGVRRCPFFIEPLLIAGYTLVFFLLAGPQRRAVAENLATLCPRATWLGRRFRALRVFWEFAWILVDSARARSGERHVTWRLDGADAFRDVSGGGGAALLLTAHMGNYDVAGPFFADKFGRTVHGVRRPERRADRQAYMELQRQAPVGNAYRVQYNMEGGFLGLELTRALASGEVVAIQGDRVAAGMGVIEVEWRGRLWRLPSGPLVLAQVAGAPVFPVFTVRDGWRSYRVVFLPARPPAAPPTDRAARVAAQRELAGWWANTLASVLERHWVHWLMFDPAFAPMPPAPAVARPVVEPCALPAPSPPSRPERTTASGWQPTLQPISRTSLGRFLNAWGLMLPSETTHQLRAEDSAQNWIEVVVLAAFSALLAAVAAWVSLVAALPASVAVALTPVVWFALLHLSSLACGVAADMLKRLPLVPNQWAVTRLSEELFFSVQTMFSLALLFMPTPFRWLGAAWLAFAAANGLCFLCLLASPTTSRKDDRT